MTIKQQNKHGAIQKVCHLHSSHLAVSHLMNFTLSHPLCYSLKIINYEVRKKTIFCIDVRFSVSRYIKGGRKWHP